MCTKIVTIDYVAKAYFHDYMKRSFVIDSAGYVVMKDSYYL